MFPTIAKPNISKGTYQGLPIDEVKQALEAGARMEENPTVQYLMNKINDRDRDNTILEIKRNIEQKITEYFGDNGRKLGFFKFNEETKTYDLYDVSNRMRGSYYKGENSRLIPAFL